MLSVFEPNLDLAGYRQATNLRPTRSVGDTLTDGCCTVEVIVRVQWVASA
jgi:hypothetical protein